MFNWDFWQSDLLPVFISKLCGPAEPPSWVLTIHGRLLDPAEATGVAPLNPDPNKQGKAPPMLATQCLKSVTITIDPKQYPGAEGTATWQQTAHPLPHKESIEFRYSEQSNVSMHCLQVLACSIIWKTSKTGLNI